MVLGVSKVCGREFKNKSNFQVHERMHTGERPFKCKFCDKAFTSSGNRREHHRRHTQTKLYACKHSNCTQSFHRHVQLIQHSRKVHGVDIKPKKSGCGGRQKYADVDLDDEKIAYVPIETFKDIEPIFEVTKCRDRNAETGLL